MDLHKLRIFATVARLGSFTRASEALHMTQPTVSQQIAVLESQIGTPLIERQSRRLRLTAAGEALLPYAEQLLALADTATAMTRAAAGLADRTLRLGIGPTLATYLLPQLLRRFRELHPQHHVYISVGNTGELLDMVAADTVDVVLVGSPAEHPKVVVTPFRHDHLVVIVAPEDAWAEREEVTVDEVRARFLFTREPGSALHASVERVLGSAALQAETCTQLAETEAIKRCVEAGLGVALIQGIAIGREVAAGTLHALALTGADDRRTYAFGVRRGRELPEAGNALLELLT